MAGLKGLNPLPFQPPPGGFVPQCGDFGDLHLCFRHLATSKTPPNGDVFFFFPPPVFEVFFGVKKMATLVKSELLRGFLGSFYCLVPLGFYFRALKQIQETQTGTTGFG